MRSSRDMMSDIISSSQALDVDATMFLALVASAIAENDELVVFSNESGICFCCACSLCV